MYYITLKSYTHHGGTQVNLNEIPEGTLIQRAYVVDDNPGMEYITVGFGDDGQFYLSAEVVEKSPQYFKKLEEAQYWKEISKREIINACLLAEERGLEPLEMVDIISEHFDLDLELDEWPEPNEKLRDASESFKKLMEEIERTKEESRQRPVQPFEPYRPYPNPYNNQPYCACGNDGTRPCWSTACPHRLHITYCSNTPPPGSCCTSPNSGGYTQTYTYTYKNKNTDDC